MGLIPGQLNAKMHMKYIRETADYIYTSNKCNPSWGDCLKEAMKRHRNHLVFLEKFEKGSEKSSIKIGVGFWDEGDHYSIILQQITLRDLDYFVFITSDKKRWIVWKGGNTDLLKNYEGDVILPLIYIPCRINEK